MSEKWEYLWVEMGTGQGAFTGGGQQVERMPDPLNPGREIMYHFLTGPMGALNKLGQEGWEAISQANANQLQWVIMKRRVSQPFGLLDHQAKCKAVVYNYLQPSVALL